MTNRALDLIPDYVLGTLSAEETREVEQAIAASPALQQEADEIREAFGLLAAELPEARPSPDVKKRLLHTVTTEDRLAPFAPALAKYFDLAVDRVREILRWADDKTKDWIDGPMPGIRLLDFDGGPRVATADVGLVWLPAGLHFPWHRHTGYEVNFVLEGHIRDYDGRVYGPGECIDKPAGSEHEFWVVSEGNVLIGVVIESGFEIVEKPE
jgi:anti-sigma factor ChrR (cupin superfamily)